MDIFKFRHLVGMVFFKLWDACGNGVSVACGLPYMVHTCAYNVVKVNHPQVPPFFRGGITIKNGIGVVPGEPQNSHRFQAEAREQHDSKNQEQSQQQDTTTINNYRGSKSNDT